MAAAQEEAEPFHWRYDHIDDKNFDVRGHSLNILLTVFCILIFFTLLCLCFRCCRFRGARSTDAATGGPTSRALRPVALDAEVISNFPIRLHRASPTGDDVQCSICLSSLVEGEKVRVLPSCGHCFHPECVDAWLRTQSSCPLCRASIPSGDP
ncbi:RING-H2 finger protein ATL66 [Typha angustifolia]|uniref:RING-H2 finger protein ATL66 n=1 Tax=Typha angustifolia TaxID=59011 RepID=UPI003C2DB04B